MRDPRGHVDNCFLILIIIIICFVVGFRLRLCEKCVCQSISLHLELETERKKLLEICTGCFTKLCCLIPTVFKSGQTQHEDQHIFFRESFKRNSLDSNGTKIFRTNRAEKKDTHIAL